MNWEGSMVDGPWASSMDSREASMEVLLSQLINGYKSK